MKQMTKLIATRRTVRRSVYSKKYVIDTREDVGGNDRSGQRKGQVETRLASNNNFITESSVHRQSRKHSTRVQYEIHLNDHRWKLSWKTFLYNNSRLIMMTMVKNTSMKLQLLTLVSVVINVTLTCSNSFMNLGLHNVLPGPRR